MHGSTRFGSDGKRPAVMYSCKASVSCQFSFGASWPRLASFAWHSDGASAGVAVGGRGLEVVVRMGRSSMGICRNVIRIDARSSS